MAAPFVPVHSSLTTLSKDTLSHLTAQFQVYEEATPVEAAVEPAVKAAIEARPDHAAVIHQVTVVVIVVTEAEITDMIIIIDAVNSIRIQTNQANRKWNTGKSMIFFSQNKTILKFHLP